MISVERAVEKIRAEMEFGLFGESMLCFFKDGDRVSYEDLWKALGIVYRLSVGHHKNLHGLCNTYIGMSVSKYSKNRWRKISIMTPYDSVAYRAF